MTEEISLPPPFIIGAAYNDELGKYEVHSIVGARMTFGRPNGSVGHTDDIPLKARIHRRIVFERQRGRPLIYKQTKRGGGTHEYTYEVVTPFVAQVIEKHSRSSREFIPHVRLQKELLRHPHARSIIDTIAPRPTLRTPEAWAGVIIAGFSKQWKAGLWQQFERKKISKGHAWRVRLAT